MFTQGSLTAQREQCASIQEGIASLYLTLRYIFIVL